MESVRFQDLVRWGDTDVLANQGKSVPSLMMQNGVPTVNADGFTNSQAGFKEKNLLLPIPEKEIMLNTNMEQNPGW